MTDRNCKECKHRKTSKDGITMCELWKCEYESNEDKVLRIKVLETVGQYFAGLVKEGQDVDLLMKCNRELLAQIRGIDNAE